MFSVFKKCLVATCVGLLLTLCCQAEPNVKSLYLFKDPALSNNTAIKSSGFNTVIIFALNVQSNGDISYPLSALGGGSPDVLLVTGGIYVGGSKYANLIKSYKAGKTNINRVEVTLSGATEIKALVDQDGTSSSTVLYKNVKALKNAWNLDAVNNDDESLYDVHSTIKFAKMLGKVGYKYTAAPYTYTDFWSTISRELNKTDPGLFDRVYLQCYDGGDGNDPGQWQDALGMKVVPLLWVVNDDKPYDGTTPKEAQTQFKQWYSEEHVAGGGYWNDYDIERENSSYTAYANALNSVFG